MLFKRDNDVELTELKKANKSLVEALNESGVDVVKLLPSNSDEFLLNEDYIRDDSSVIWGSSKITYTDAIMFKAGKQSALQQFSKQLDSAHTELEERRAKITHLTNELQVSESVRADQVGNLTSEKDTMIRNHAIEVDKLNAENYELRQTIDDLRQQIDVLSEELRCIDTKRNECAEVDDVNYLAYCKYGHIFGGEN